MPLCFGTVARIAVSVSTKRNCLYTITFMSTMRNWKVNLHFRRKCTGFTIAMHLSGVLPSYNRKLCSQFRHLDAFTKLLCAGLSSKFNLLMIVPLQQRGHFGVLDNIITDQGMYVHIKNCLDQAKNKPLQNDFFKSLHWNATSKCLIYVHYMENFTLWTRVRPIKPPKLGQFNQLKRNTFYLLQYN